MSDLNTNKILGAGLATALTVTGLWVGVPLFFKAPPAAKDGYAIAVAAESGGDVAAVDTPPDWGTVLKTADVSAGQAKTAICASCHNFDAGGANGTGPGLYGVVGRKPGSHPAFAYSAGMSAFGAKQPVWDYQHIYEFLKGPSNYISGTKMTYLGMKDSQDRINVIAYLQSLGSTLPVPAPNPKATAPAAAAAPAKASEAPAKAAG